MKVTKCVDTKADNSGILAITMLAIALACASEEDATACAYGGPAADGHVARQCRAACSPRRHPWSRWART